MNCGMRPSNRSVYDSGTDLCYDENGDKESELFSWMPANLRTYLNIVHKRDRYHGAWRCTLLLLHHAIYRPNLAWILQSAHWIKSKSCDNCRQWWEVAFLSRHHGSRYGLTPLCHRNDLMASSDEKGMPRILCWQGLELLTLVWSDGVWLCGGSVLRTWCWLGSEL